MPHSSKRHFSLVPFSREHHHGLLLCWKIRMGLKNEVDPHRIKRYVDWFFTHHLLDHFAIEEKELFPILGLDNPLVQKAIAEHHRLEELFKTTTKMQQTLQLIDLELDHHIRFEERILFVEIQKRANEKELQLLADIHKEIEDTDDWEDNFWD